MGPGAILQRESQSRYTASALKSFLKDEMNDNSGRSQGSPDNAYLRQILQREASSRSNDLTRAAGLSGLPPTLGAGSAGMHSSFSRQERLQRGGATLSLGTLPTHGLELAGLPPPALRQSQSLDMALPNLRAAQSLTIDAPRFARNASLEYASVRRAAALRPGAPGMYSSLYDQQQHIWMSQQHQQRAGFRQPGGPVLGAPMTTGMPRNPPVWRNIPNEGVSAQGLELLRAASMSLPNRSGPRPEPLAARIGQPIQDSNLAVSMSARTPGFTPQGQNNWASAAGNEKSRKANREQDSEDDETASTSAKKVFIPEVRDLDILCGRGGKSNHHFG